MKDENALILIDETNITDIIYTIRGKQVMLDSDLASLYQVTTKRLNEQVSRNKNRFPAEFMFRLTKEEYENFFRREKNKRPPRLLLGGVPERPGWMTRPMPSWVTFRVPSPAWKVSGSVAFPSSCPVCRSVKDTSPGVESMIVYRTSS